ncbi:DUF371 domain-containing protein [Desulfurococcus amylolyticus]|uniref:DUF371 domain-containing protein n=1 Tax=Desulfurococcus TaxID=2273 RepID=UPI0023F31147|nr:DUF371 domain-containing protein [Desulfurococcus amylolyticus]
MVEAEIVYARGHPRIKATHVTTLEISREEYLTERGDCIIGIGADRSPKDFSRVFKEALRRDDSILLAVIRVGGLVDIVLAQGSSGLIVDSPVKLIIRRSSFIEPATIGIKANKAARDIDRRIIQMLRDPGTVLELRLYVLGLDEVESIYAGSRGILQD